MVLGQQMLLQNRQRRGLQRFLAHGNAITARDSLLLTSAAVIILPADRIVCPAATAAD